MNESDMKKIFLLNTPTAFILLLATNVADPLLALEFVKPNAFTQVKQNTIEHLIVEKLTNRGLDQHAAVEKASILLEGVSEEKLLHLQNNKSLNLSSESIIHTLSNYALYGKRLDLSDYDSLTGLIQDIKGVGLSAAQRNAISDITLLNSLG